MFGKGVDEQIVVLTASRIQIQGEATAHHHGNNDESDEALFSSAATAPRRLFLGRVGHEGVLVPAVVFRRVLQGFVIAHGATIRSEPESNAVRPPPAAVASGRTQS